MLFWWNSQCRIKINPKPNLRLYFLLLFHFISFHFSLLLLNFCSCFWTMKGVSNFFYFRYGHEKHKLQKSCVYAQPWVIWLLEFSLRKQAKMRKKMIPTKKELKAYEWLKLSSLLFYLNGFTLEFIGRHINNILLISWGQTVRQKMLKFLIIGFKIFWPQLLI